jgi:hypothetical protein
MADLADKAEKGSRYDETASADEKPAAAAIEDSGQQQRMTMEPPEFIRGLTPEERHRLETQLKRKVDVRLLPAIIIMYILNYIDRCVTTILHM